MWNIILILYGIAAIALFLIIIKKPKFINPILIITTVSTAGLVFKHGAPIIDDVFLVLVIIGIIFLLLANKLSLIQCKFNKLDKLHYAAFSTLMIYLILQSFRSSIMYQDIKIIRWIFFFFALLFISFILTRTRIVKLSRKHISLLIILCAIVYTIVYIVAGYYSEKVRDISRWELQAEEWPQTINAIFISVIAVPAAFFLIAEKKIRYQIIGIGTIILFFAAASYYDSKALILTLFIFTLTAPTVLSKRKKIIWIIFIFFFLTIINSTYLEQPINSIYGSFIGMFTNKNSDIDRYNHIRAPILAVNAHPFYTMFGYGMHTHNFILIPYLEQLYGIKFYKADTTGFSSYLVNTGYMGLLLLALNFALTAYRIVIQKNNKGKTMLVTSLGLTAAWLLLSDILGMTLFYFMIMPNGLLIQLCQTTNKQKPLQLK